jgi:biopolymer transport protein ExbD
MRITHLLVFTLPMLVFGCKKEESVFPGKMNTLPTEKQSAAVSEWDKVKIGESGDIFVGKKKTSLVEFSKECARLKQSGGAILLFIDAPNHLANPAQAEVIRKIVDAGVAMKLTLKESDLE